MSDRNWAGERRTTVDDPLVIVYASAYLANLKEINMSGCLTVTVDMKAGELLKGLGHEVCFGCLGGGHRR